MKIIISGRHMEIGESLKQHIENATQQMILHYVGDALETHVTLSKEAYLFHCEISVHISHHLVARSKMDDGDPYRCFDAALVKLEKRVTRYKSRLRDQKRQGPSFDNDAGMAAQQYVINGHMDTEHDQETPLVIAEMKSEIPTVSVSEAVMRMDLNDHQVVMFKNPTHGRLNVVYRRADGHIGWIDPTLQVTG